MYIPENVQDFSSSLSPPTQYRRYWSFSEGGGFSKTKTFKEMFKINWNFQRGRGILEKKTFRGRGMDILWNYTIVFHALTHLLAKKKGTLDQFVKTAPTNTRFRASE